MCEKAKETGMFIYLAAYCSLAWHVDSAITFKKLDYVCAWALPAAQC